MVMPPLITAPSKTFLLGEYAVLKYGQALVLTTPPYFSLSLTSTSADKIIPPFSAASPAGKLYKAYYGSPIFKPIVFRDPHYQQGGLGASSAQFVLLARYMGATDPWEIWQQYRAYTQSDKIIPSGADVLAQTIGYNHIVYVDLSKRYYEKLTWPFPAWSIILIRTGEKLPTHEHLAQLTTQDFFALAELVTPAYQAIKTKNASLFINALQNYAELLIQLHKVAPLTQQLLTQLSYRSEVVAAKGCGAMGADVILAVVKTTEKLPFLAWLKELSLRVVYSGEGGDG